MFELADRLVGIYKTYNCTKTVTINPGKIASAASATASDNLHAAHAAAAGGTGNTQAAGTQEPTQKKRHLATSATGSGAALQDQAAAKNAKVAATAAEWFNIFRMIRLWKIINTYRFIIRPVVFLFLG